MYGLIIGPRRRGVSRKQALARQGRRGFTLIEQLFALLLAGITVSAVVSGFWQSVQQAEWSAHSLAAQSLAQQVMEQARAARWDPNGSPSVDNLQQTNFPTRTEILDVPTGRGQNLLATTRTTIRTISESPPLKMVEVQTTWRFGNRRALYTNAIATYRAPDQ
jgi:prepilin-type N-terminal cleavage/methylation domain-containing protein